MGDREIRHKYTRKKNSIRLPKTIKTAKYINDTTSHFHKKQSRSMRDDKRDKYNKFTRYCSTNLCKLQRQQHQVGGSGNIFTRAIGITSKDEYAPKKTIMQEIESDPKSNPCTLKMAPFDSGGWQEYTGKTISLQQFTIESVIAAQYYTFSDEQFPQTIIPEMTDSNDYLSAINNGYAGEIIEILSGVLPKEIASAEVVPKLKNQILHKSFGLSDGNNILNTLYEGVSGYYPPNQASVPAVAAAGGGGAVASLQPQQKPWVMCPSEIWNTVYNNFQREINSTAYMLRVFANSYVTSKPVTEAVVKWEFIGSIFDMLYNITGEWEKDKRYFNLIFRPGGNVKAKPRLIIAAGPSSAGKTYGAVGIIRLLSTNASFPDTFFAVDGGNMRRECVCYQSVIEIIKKNGTISGFTNLVDPGGIVSYAKKQTQPVSLFDSNIVKTAVNSYLLYHVASTRKNISLYVPETFGFCGSLDCSNVYKKYLDITGDHDGWNCFYIYQHKYGGWTAETIQLYIDSIGDPATKAIWETNKDNWTSRHDCDFPIGYTCSGVVESGMVREQSEGKKYSSGAYENSKTNGHIVMKSAPGLRVELHNSGYEDSTSTITDYSDSGKRLIDLYPTLFKSESIVLVDDKQYYEVTVGNFTFVYKVADSKDDLKNLPAWKVEDRVGQSWNNYSSVKSRLTQTTSLLCSHNSRLQCFLDTILRYDFKNGQQIPGEQTRFQNCAIIRMTLAKYSNDVGANDGGANDSGNQTFFIDIHLVYSGELSPKEKTKISPDRPYYMRQIDITPERQEQAAEYYLAAFKKKNKNASDQEIAVAKENGYNNSYKPFNGMCESFTVVSGTQNLSGNGNKYLELLNIKLDDIPNNTSQTIYFIRHGQGQHNVSGTMAARTHLVYDTPVTELGINQAQRAGAQLYDIVAWYGDKFSYFFASDLDRSRTTIAQVYNGMLYRQTLYSGTKYDFLADNQVPKTPIDLTVVPCTSELPYKVNGGCDAAAEEWSITGKYGLYENFSKCTLAKIQDSNDTCHTINISNIDPANTTTKFLVNWKLYLAFYEQRIRRSVPSGSITNSYLKCKLTNMVSLVLGYINGKYSIVNSAGFINSYIEGRQHTYIDIGKYKNDAGDEKKRLYTTSSKTGQWSA